MKEFWEIMSKDIYSEHFTRKEYIVYGVVVPLAFVVLAIVANLFE